MGFRANRLSNNRALAPVVRKPINANPRLNRPNPRSKFILQLNSVPQRPISTIQGLNKGLNLTHLARWIKSLIGGTQSNKSKWRTYTTEFDFTVLSRTSHSAFGFPALFRVFTPRTDRCLAIHKMVLHDESEARNFNISDLRGRNRRLLAAFM